MRSPSPPYAWVIVLRPRRCASSTIAWTSSGVVDVDAGIVVRAHVLDGREAAVQICETDVQSMQRHLALVRPFRETVHVPINQPRQHRRLAEIDHAGARGNLHATGWADVGDAVTLDEDHLI